MNQEEHISLLLQSSQENKSKDQKIRECYERYLATGDHADFSELITQMDSRCVKWVRKQLWLTGCCDDENEHEIMQNARLAVWSYLTRCRQNGSHDGEFEAYAFGIYKKKTLDVIRKVSRKRKNYGAVESLDEPILDGDSTRGDGVTGEGPFDPPAIMEWEEKREMYEMLFHTYCIALTSSKAYPPRGLALFFARILPHMLHVNHHEETIPDTKATSAKWAFERMGQRTVGRLGTDSEHHLKKQVSEKLEWCNEFYRRLEDEVDTPMGRMALKNAIYTVLFNKGKIEDWADSMHKTVIKDAAIRILGDPKLKEIAMSYIPKRDALFSFVKGGAER